MRVIAGSARRLPLRTVKGMSTRPTTDRIKETLFNMLQPSIGDCVFLDLFSGSGAIAIEALSRGARLAVLVENNREALECIRENLNKTKLEDRGLVMDCDVLAGLRKLEGRGYLFDIIFMDPPYNHDYEHQILEYLAGSPMADQNTAIIIEADRETDTRWITSMGFRLIKVKEYKTNKHLFVGKGEA